MIDKPDAPRIDRRPRARGGGIFLGGGLLVGGATGIALGEPSLGAVLGLAAGAAAALVFNLSRG